MFVLHKFLSKFKATAIRTSIGFSVGLHRLIPKCAVREQTAKKRPACSKEQGGRSPPDVTMDPEAEITGSHPSTGWTSGPMVNGVWGQCRGRLERGGGPPGTVVRRGRRDFGWRSETVGYPRGEKRNWISTSQLTPKHLMQNLTPCRRKPGRLSL